MTKLQRAVAAWIRAEWEFRHGKRAYSRQTEDWFVKAEKKVRKVLTGFHGLNQAKRNLPEESE